MKKGKLFIISAPSGAGKTTLIKEVLGRFPDLSYSISHTTRLPRKGEKDGQDYFFVTADLFEQMIAENLWLEWAKVHDNYYGTSREFVDQTLEKGKHLILDIDVQGACQLMDAKLDAVTIFIAPPSFEVLAQRLEKRATDAADVIQKRLENAKFEMQKKDLYQYTVINDDLAEAKAAICDIFEKEL